MNDKEKKQHELREKIYDMNQKLKQPIKFNVNDLPKKYRDMFNKILFNRDVELEEAQELIRKHLE